MDIQNFNKNIAIFYQNSQDIGIFRKNPTNITLLVLSVILVLILIATIIWRIFYKRGNKISKNSEKIGVIDKEFNDFILYVSSEENIKILYNVLIKNKYAKLKYSIIPAIIFQNNMCYIISNIVKNNSKHEIIISKNPLNIVELGKNKIFHKNVNLNWYNEILKYLENLIGKENCFKKLILLKNAPKNLINETNFIVTNIFDIMDVLNNVNMNKLTDLEIDKITNKLNKENQWKIKNKDLR